MTSFEAGVFTPAPARGPLWRMVAVQARTEAALALRNGEQVLLTLLIPLALLVTMTVLRLIPLPEPRVDSVAPRILALAVMSSAFTGQAIALGFDRRYGVLKRLAATAVPRWLLVVGRMLAAVAVVVVQLVVLCAAAVLLGWTPAVRGIPFALGLILLGTLAFGALGALLGGALRAEIVLAAANFVWFALLLVGGIALPAGALPGGLDAVVGLLPSGALAESLRSALVDGMAPGWQPVLVLLCWGAAGAGLAVKTIRLS
ncbi:MAG: ABC transporter permease [Kutzneria sp.]|nr:ABC transporter permease [Kutzneria sp.]MBV9844376.1 ABC transporter permease [Kutzneria sp.]